MKPARASRFGGIEEGASTLSDHFEGDLGDRRGRPYEGDPSRNNPHFRNNPDRPNRPYRPDPNNAPGRRGYPPNPPRQPYRTPPFRQYPANPDYQQPRNYQQPRQYQQPRRPENPRQYGDPARYRDPRQGYRQPPPGGPRQPRRPDATAYQRADEPTEIIEPVEAPRHHGLPVAEEPWDEQNTARGTGKSRKKRMALLGSAAAAVVAAVVVALVTFTGGDQQVAAGDSGADHIPESSSAPVDPAAPGQQPGTIRLPEGGTAQLVRRELTSDGTLPIPEGLDDATWWGAKLGAPHGASLLSGHVNWKGKIGPFNELWQAKDGQDVSVVDKNGGQWIYRISDVLTVPKSELPAHAQELFGQDGPHRLVLATCGGDYVGGTEGYADNRIVTAKLVSRPS
jgi:hypothetical protein